MEPRWGSYSAGEINSDPKTKGLHLDPNEKSRGFPMAEIRTRWYLQGLYLSE